MLQHKKLQINFTVLKGTNDVRVLKATNDVTVLKGTNDVTVLKGTKYLLVWVVKTFIYSSFVLLEARQQVGSEAKRSAAQQCFDWLKVSLLRFPETEHGGRTW